MSDQYENLRVEIEHAINRCSAENASDTPDFILAMFLTGCLRSFDAAVRTREKWYGREAGRITTGTPIDPPLTTSP